MTSTTSEDQKSKVVVIGGGFGGLHVMRSLVKDGYEVTLIDRNPYTTFQPLLYQVATGGLNPGDITYSLRRFVTGRTKSRGPGSGAFRRATVTGIDLENKKVLVTRGEPVEYDKLVLAPGVGPNFFGIPGAEENSMSIYSRKQALDVRDVIFSGLEALTAKRDPDKRFTVLVVGGGATGVEMAGTLAELKTEALPVVYPEIHTDNFRVVLAEMAPALLTPFEPKLQRYTNDELRRRGVDVRLNTAVAEVRSDRVTFKDGNELAVDVVIWASGVAAHESVNSWGLPQSKGGRIVINSNLEVDGIPDVYAIGDAAVDPDNPLAQLAQPAIQMGNHVAEQIARADRGEPLEPFAYVDKGTMATIGRGSAVADLFGKVSLTGRSAWLTWVVVHLSTLLGGRNRLQAMINMAYRYATWPQSAAGIVGDIVPPPSEREVTEK